MLSLLFKMMYFQSFMRQQSTTMSLLLNFDSSPLLEEMFSFYSNQPTSPWFTLAVRQKETASGWQSNVFAAAPVFMAVSSFPQFTNQNNNLSHSAIKDYLYTRRSHSKPYYTKINTWARKKDPNHIFLLQDIFLYITKLQFQ